MLVPLPIDPQLPKIVAHVRESRRLVLVASPGAGKTTRVPPAILRAGLLSAEHPNLVMLQPRRVAARAAAERIADENGWQVGGQVGYHVRFDRKIGRDTRLRVMTEGILTRQLLDDPLLEGVGCVILDEFHERSIHTDLAAALLKEVRAARSDLIVIVMSATLDAGPVAAFLDDAPIITVEGRTYPIETTYSPPSGDPLEARIATAVDRLVHAVAKRSAAAASSTDRPNDDNGNDDPGDILVFLPGAGEINRAARALTPIGARHDLLVLPLHGSLPPDQQSAALRPASRRKVILSTNIAETSLTIDGVRTVIDSGLARVAGYDVRRGLDRLDVQRISKASATQRAGRAGRTAPGQCIRLWTQREQNEMAAFDLPEIRRVDLAATVLTLHAWGRPDARAFEWYEAPDERTLLAAERLLFLLGLTDAEVNGRITERGQAAAQVPVHPRLGRLMVEAGRANLWNEGAALAALLSEKDIATFEGRPHERVAKTHGSSDLVVRLAMLERAERERFDWRLRDEGIDPEAARTVARVRDELQRQKLAVGRNHPHPNPLPGYREREPEAALLRLVLAAYPDRVCKRRENDPAAGVMVGGAGVRLANESIVKTAPYFVAVDARADDRARAGEALVRIASEIDPAWLAEMFPQAVVRERQHVFDEAKQRVVARSVARFLDLPLSVDDNAPVDANAAGPILAAALRPRAVEWFKTDEPAGNLLARVALLRQHMPGQPWPSFDDDMLGEVLAEACAGKRSVDEVRRTPAVALLEAHLPYPLDRSLDQHAPLAIEVPSGSRMKIDYTSGPAPVLAVRLQELFGWTDTPRLAGGRVPVVLHLLGPNYRPVQVTQDLKNFWATTYFQVRKDLKARYPKHAWPEDPLAAPAERRGRSTKG
jgi:ATP-dependent helicase HrpB